MPFSFKIPIGWTKNLPVGLTNNDDLPGLREFDSKQKETYF